MLCADVVKFVLPEVREIARCLPDKFLLALPLSLARGSRQNLSGQLQTICSECSKFHTNPFTSGGVIAERVNVVKTRYKVFPILGEATASSPSKNCHMNSKYKHGNRIHHTSPLLLHLVSDLEYTTYWPHICLANYRQI